MFSFFLPFFFLEFSKFEKDVVCPILVCVFDGFPLGRMAVSAMQWLGVRIVVGFEGGGGGGEGRGWVDISGRVVPWLDGTLVGLFLDSSVGWLTFLLLFFWSVGRLVCLLVARLLSWLVDE